MSELKGDDGDAKLLDRIAARFPTVASARIEEILHEEQARLDGGRIRDYIPVLVERATTERLRGEAVPVPLTAVDDPSRPVAAVRADPNRLDPLEIDRRSQATGPLLGDLGGPLA
ncbi:three-helix bundle dimerization domain-containing protein [Microbacterium sp. SD291]|uniref:three-helix bundle dimerization domain-containing protein n=1 Tax=Microbacterium sp. SD291 TaxID=2782007 RepID=UPI001A96AE04|nr:DUF3562 domain-containing protein [Microbacterium sp. SD291]MBO0980790.1 hypothetical protein [Microbacterium sp. SD291]